MENVNINESERSNEEKLRLALQGIGVLLSNEEVLTYFKLESLNLGEDE